MNDFTKDDLIYLNELLEICIEGFSMSDKCFEMKIKIQSLIDNYCNHEKKENIGGWVSKCVKCGLKFGDETQ